MSATDLSLSELRARAILELKTVTGSEAYSQTLIDMKINEGYQAVFNQPKKNVYVREDSAEFMTISDTSVNGTLNAGDTVINVGSTTGYPTAGAILVGTDFVSYTGKTATTFTGCTGVGTTRSDGPTVRPCYPVNTYLTGVDEQQIRAILLQEQPLTYKAFDAFVSVYFSDAFKYTLFKGYLIFPQNRVTQRILVSFFKAIVPMTLDDDKPALIPNSFRPMLVYYAVGLILILDDERTGWDKYYKYNPQRPEKSEGLYFEWLRNFYAKYNRRVDQDIKRAGSVYD